MSDPRDKIVRPGRLHQLVAASLTRAAGVLRTRSPARSAARPAVGQLWAWTDATQPVQWLVLEVEDLPRPRLHLVAIDTLDIEGENDLEIVEELTGARLSLRGAHDLWLSPESFSGARLTGQVSSEDLDAARRQHRHPRPSLRSEGVDTAPDYSEWTDEVLRPAVIELQTLGRQPQAERAPAQGPRSTRGWRRAAAAIVLLTGGLVAGLGINLGSRPGTPGPVSAIFVPLTPTARERSDDEAGAYRVTEGATHYSLLLALGEDADGNALHLRLDNAATGAVVEAAALTPVTVAGRRYVSVVIPGTSLTAGSWTLELTGSALSVPLRYQLTVD